MEGKHISYWSKIGAVIFVVGAFIISAILGWHLNATDIIYIGGFVAVMGAPIDLSIVLTKIFGPKA